MRLIGSICTLAWIPVLMALCIGTTIYAVTRPTPTPNPSAKIVFVALKADALEAGSYEAIMAGQDNQRGSVLPAEVNREDICVTVGEKTLGVSFYARPDFEWRAEGADFCLRPKGN